MKRKAVALVDSLLTAMVRADGDALVMHVGERPIVVAGAKTIDLSTHGMNLGAMVGMLGQLLSGEALSALREFGAVEHTLPSRGEDHFSVVAARSGDDIWIEIRRRRQAPQAEEPAAEPALPVEEPEPAAAATAEPQREAEPVAATELEPVSATEVEPVTATEPADFTAIEPEPVAATEAEPVTATEVEPVAATEPEPVAVTEPEPAAEPEPVAEPESVPEPGLAAEPEPVAVVEPALPELEPAAVAATEATAMPDDEARPSPEPVSEPEPETEPVPVFAGAGEPDGEPEPEAPAAEPVPEPEIAPLAADETTNVEAEAAPVMAEADEPAAIEEVAEAAPVEAIAVSTADVPATPVQADEDAQVEEVAAEEAVAAAASVDATLDTPAHADVPAVAAMASAGASAYPSTFAPVVPMESERPSRPSTPLSPVGVAGTPSLPEPQLTRTVRIEVPERTARAAGLDRLLRAADAVGASELFLVSQTRPYVRVGGNVRPLSDEAALVATDIDALIADVTPEPWRDAVRRGDPAEWLIELADIGRVRCSTFRDLRGPGANFHFAFLRAATADELQLSAEARRLATEPDGLILVAGGAVSDMSAIVAAFVDILNHQRADYIVTLEPQVRVLHVNREALVSQREVGHDPVRVATAARAALREEPDVLVIEGITTGELARLAIEAAAQDRLVIASIDAPSAPAAVQRLVGLVSDDQRQAARATLAQCFRGAVAQLLLRKVTGGRIAARELLSGTRAVARLLADGDLSRLSEAAEAPGAGHVTMSDTIVEFVRSGVVDLREAVRKAPDGHELVHRLQAAGVDVAGLDR